MTNDNMMYQMTEETAKELFFLHPESCVVFDGDTEGNYILPTRMIVHGQRFYAYLSRDQSELLIEQGAQRHMLYPDRHPLTKQRERKRKEIRTAIDDALHACRNPVAEGQLLRLESHIATLVRHLEQLLENSE